MKRILFILMLMPQLLVSQTKEQKLEEITITAEALSDEAYKQASALSDSLLAKHPNDSLVILNRVRLFHSYVRKSKCQKHNFPTINNLCENALEFYNTSGDKINYPRLSVSKGLVYYNWAKYGGKPTKQKAVVEFEKALQNADLADFEKLRIQTLIDRL